jgi:hypothetical protein
MTTTTATQSQTKVCAQTISSIAVLLIGVHFAHEGFTVLGDLPVVQVAVGVTVFVAMVALVGLWYRTAPAVRRTLAVVLGALWSVAASEHLGNLSDGSALDYTGVLAFVGGLVLAFAAYWDASRPVEPAR